MKKVVTGSLIALFMRIIRNVGEVKFLRKLFLLFFLLGNCIVDSSMLHAQGLLSIPDKLVVLTFDDGCKSDLEFVMPLLKKYDFQATFFFTDRFLRDDKLKDENYMTWEDALMIHEAGFEIGNHTKDHPNVAKLTDSKFKSQLQYIEDKCKEYGIAIPKTFCYPGFEFDQNAVSILREKGYYFARRGVFPEFIYNEEGSRGPVYEPAEDDPLLIPSTGFSGPDWDFEDFLWALEQGGQGKIPVLTFHGVPDYDHPWVNTDTTAFRTYMDYLLDNDYRVIAMRDLVKYVDPSKYPADSFEPINRRINSPKIVVSHLRCEYTNNPIGLDTERPRFSWSLQSNQRGQMQTAYQILVSSSKEKLSAGIGDKWNSGKVTSEKSVNIPYNGTSLSSGEKYWWQVRAWDSAGLASEYGQPATFEMGLLNESDWEGEWIGISPTTGLHFIEGSSGKAISLDGTRGTFRIPHDLKMKPQDEITISAWVQPDRNPVSEQLNDWMDLYRNNDGVECYRLALGTNNESYGLLFGLSIDTSYSETFASVDASHLMDGEWHHIAATFDGSMKRIYVDGKEIGSATANGSILPIPRSGSARPTDKTNTKPIYIGSDQATKGFFSGGIDELRVYSSALSAKEIKQGPKTEENLVGWWKLDGDLSNSALNIDGEAVGDVATSPLLRKAFEVTKKVKQARVYVSGLGWYELYINGEKVGDHVLDPATTDYDKRILYVSYDVTKMLKSGANGIGAILGNGWYSEPPAAGYAEVPRLLMQMNVLYEDGSTATFKTDQSWKANGSPILRNDIYGGETYDARLEIPSWTEGNFDDSNWESVVKKAHPGGGLESQLMPAIKMNQTIKPIKLSNPKPGVYVYDMGQLFAGWVRIRMKGESGSKVTIKYAERMIEKSGLVNKSRHPAPMETDFYVLKGDPQGEEYEPRFTYHPVRYVQIEGYPGMPTLEDLDGRVIHSDVDLTNEFHCSNELLNQIHRNSVWTMRNGVMGFPLDCLHREHWGWLDPGTDASMLYSKIHMPLFWTKWMRDIRHTQHPNGVIPDIAPASPLKGRKTGDASWAGNYPIMVWHLYQYYEDRNILEENYSSMKKMVDHFTSISEGHLINEGYYGDHMLPGDAPGKEEFHSTETPRPLLRTGHYYRDVSIISQAAAVLGKSNDAKSYAMLADKIKEAINNEWFDEDNCQYATGSQTSNLFPLALGIVPEDCKEAVLNHVKKSIVEEYDGHLHTGNIGTASMMEVLVAEGLGEVMYDVASVTTYPGWGYMVKEGATTIWEAWGKRNDMNSGEANMVMWCMIEEFFVNSLAGIQGPSYYGPSFVAPGFREIRIKPHVLGDLTQASASIKTVRGKVSSGWERKPDSLRLEVTLPVNSQGIVHVPKTGLRNVVVTEGGRSVWKAGALVTGTPGLYAASEDSEYVTFDVGSGSYYFELTGQRD